MRPPAASVGLCLWVCAGVCGCGEQSPSRPLQRAPSPPRVEVGPATRPAPRSPVTGPLAYYGAVVHAELDARQKLREAEIRGCFRTGLALRHGKPPTTADQVRQILIAGGYPLSRLPAGHAVIYDPARRQIFLIPRDAAPGGGSP